MRSLAEGKIRWCFYPPPAAGTDQIATASGPTAPEGGDATDENAKDTPSLTAVDDNDGRGIWLGDFEHEEADDLLSTHSDDEDDPVDDAHKTRKRNAADLLEQQRYADSDEGSEEDSEDDGEVEEAERKGREIDKGFFAALDLGEEDEEDIDT
jgi:hypothetical protein